jgi:hypothetical protein
MGKGKQTSYMALHADARCKAPPPHVSTGTDLWAGQRVEVSLQIVPERPSEPWPLAIYQHTEHNLPRPRRYYPGLRLLNG